MKLATQLSLGLVLISGALEAQAGATRNQGCERGCSVNRIAGKSGGGDYGDQTATPRGPQSQVPVTPMKRSVAELLEHDDASLWRRIAAAAAQNSGYQPGSNVRDCDRKGGCGRLTGVVKVNQDGQPEINGRPITRRAAELFGQDDESLLTRDAAAPTQNSPYQSRPQNHVAPADRAGYGGSGQSRPQLGGVDRGYSQYSVPPTPIPFRRSVPDLSGQDDESLLRRVAADAEMIGDVYVREAVAFDDDFDIYAREAEIDESLDFEYSF